MSGNRHSDRVVLQIGVRNRVYRPGDHGSGSAPRCGAEHPEVRILGIGLLIVLSTLVLGAVPQPATAATGKPAPHAPIPIQRDADFSASNGVGSGSETAGDPCVIGF